MKRNDPIFVSGLALALSVLLLAAGCSRGGGEQAKAGANGGSGGAQGAAAAPGAPGATPAADAATPVRVFPAARRTVRRTVPVTGSIAALQSVDLAPKLTARVVRVIEREGATVRRGQVVVQQDTSDIINDVQKAEANVQAARARLAQIETQSRVQNASTVGEIENTRQQLRQAEAALALARRPQRTQEIAVAENAVRQAEANLENVAVARNAIEQAQANYDRARADRARYEQLVREGAAAQSLLDQYVTQEQVARAALASAKQQASAQEKTARAALNSARQQLSVAREGGRAENVRTAESQVVRARLAYSQARTNLQQIQARQSDIGPPARPSPRIWPR
jgi:multidrug efflux pump subunit AcrA (membrane-fusion protein)